jgi:Holliday junction resolvasome RuvABC endonuclease subunit
MIGIVMGIMETFSVALNIGVEWYSEGDSKNSVLGKGAASKDEMIYAIKKLYPDLKLKNVKYYDEAICDAMGVYHVAMQQSNALKLFGYEEKT